MKEFDTISKIKLVNRLKWKIVLLNMLFGAIYLFFSEGIASFFNINLDTFSAKLASTFKDTVVALYFVFINIITLVVLRTLKPLFNYLKDGSGDYKKARKATINVPIIMIWMQIALWLAATTGYFILKNWQPDSGIPYAWVLFMKLGGGVSCAVTMAFYIQIFTMRIKKELNIISIFDGEDDFFIKHANTFVLSSFGLYTISHLGYLSYYNYHRPFTEGGFLSFGIGFIFISAVFVGIGAFLLFLARKVFTYQSDFIKSKLDELKSGKADLSKRILLINFDEIGELAFRFNQFIENLNNDFIILKDMSDRIFVNSKEMANSSMELASNTEEQASGTEEISATMDEYTHIMETVQQNVENQLDIIIEISTKSKGLFEGLTHIIQYSNEAKEKTSANLSSAEKGVETVKLSVLSSKKITKRLNEITLKISDAAKKTEHIDQILTSIEDIAEQTNLLSMNAAIEAAHAGDAGTGFAIVADEIRQLAINSSQAVGNISDIMSEIKSSVEEAVKLAEEENSEAISYNKHSEQSNKALTSIIQNMRDTSDMINNIYDIASGQEKTVRDFSGQTQNLEQFAVEINDSVQDQTSHAEQIKSSLLNISQSYEDNARYSEKLSNLANDLEQVCNNLTTVIGQFKTDNTDNEKN